jgi:hypothetical protein
MCEGFDVLAFLLPAPPSAISRRLSAKPVEPFRQPVDQRLNGGGRENAHPLSVRHALFFRQLSGVPFCQYTSYESP